MERVKPLLLELERHPQNVLIISHRAVLRTLMAYFSETPRDQMVETNIPLHQVFPFYLAHYKLLYSSFNVILHHTVSKSFPIPYWIEYIFIYLSCSFEIFIGTVTDNN